MSFRPALDPYGGRNPLVDKQIGDVYPTVRYVAEHLAYLVFLAQNINELRPLDVELDMDPTTRNVRWRYVSKTNDAPWSNLIALADITGPSIELQENGEYLQYRPVGTEEWENLIPISNISGKTAEMRQQGNEIQWRLEDDAWVPLFDMSGIVNSSNTALANSNTAKSVAESTEIRQTSLEQRQSVLEAGQTSNALYFATKAQLDAVTGTANQGAFVTSGAEAGQYKWNGTAWEFLRADGLFTKLDKSEFSDTILKPTSDTDLLVAITDSQGRSTWLQANRETGGLTDLSVRHIRAAVPGLPEGEEAYEGILAAITDKDGRGTWLQANKKDGGPTRYAIDHIRRALEDDTAQPLIVCEGDSMTASNYDGGLTYPAKLAALLGRTVVNMGISGTTAAEISIRAGGVIPLLTLPSGSIPADTTAIPISWNVSSLLSGGSQPARTYSGKVRGVPVNLVWTPSTGVLTLARKTLGTTIAMSSPVAFEMDTPYLNDNIHVVWSGRNDYPKSGAYNSIEAEIARLEKVGAPFIVMGVCNSNSEPSGSSAYNDILALNAQIQKRAPLQYVDIRGRLIREGLSLAGLTPTSEDLAAIAVDRIPPQLMYDNLHVNTKGRDAVALIVSDELNYRGLL